MKKRQKGSITVEATLFLPLFFLAFVSIYSLISFTRAQLIVQYAADQAAKEVAQYSYILEKIGILDSLDGLNSRSEDFEKNIKSSRTFAGRNLFRGTAGTQKTEYERFHSVGTVSCNGNDLDFTAWILGGSYEKTGCCGNDLFAWDCLVEYD